MQTGRPLWAEVDLDALTHNIRQIQRRIGPDRQILAVVKANAYGHGAPAVAGAAVAAGATHLGVACVDEGVQLRAAGIGAPIVLLGFLPAWEAAVAVVHRLTPTVTTPETAHALDAACRTHRTTVDIHLKIDTGMGRFGVNPDEAPAFAQFLQTLPTLNLRGVYTHFAVADETDKTFTRRQFALFMETAGRLPPGLLRHVANSAAIADLPEMGLDMVRPGIALYGCYPSPYVGRDLDLRPVLSLKSYVARVHTLAAGETVSYGRTWTAPRASRIALIPCGYADGLPRITSNRGAVLIRGRRAPVVGRVCMDQHMVDVTDIPEVALGDEAVIIGRQGDAVITAEEIAALAGTINYEVLCAVAARVPRHYLQGGRAVSRSSLLDPLGGE
ncbi:MAG: alanine racemase [Chloroflexota bacterium]